MSPGCATRFCKIELPAENTDGRSALTTDWRAPPADPDLCLDEVHLWRAELDAPAPVMVEALAETLSVEEAARAGRFRFETDRRRFVVAHGWLREVLAGYLRLAPARLAFAAGPFGKPCLKPADAGTSWLRFNLTHAGGLAVLAVARGREVGVDAEPVRPLADMMVVAGRFFSAREQAELRALHGPPRTRAFFRIWTRKEAMLKACGTGLGSLPDEPMSMLDPKSLIKTVSPVKIGTISPAWCFVPFVPAPHYVGTLVIERTAILRHSNPDYIRTHQRLTQVDVLK